MPASQLIRFFSLSIDMLCIISISGEFELVNPAFEKTLGYKEQDFLARSFIDFVHPDDQAATKVELQQVFKGIPTRNFKVRFLHQNGSIRWLAWTATSIEDKLFAVGRDITNHQQLQIQTEQERYLLRTLIDSLPDYIFVKDSNGRIILNNLAHARLLGRESPIETIGMTDTARHSADVIVEHQADDLEVLRTGEAINNQEETLRDETDQLRWLLTTKLPLRLSHQGEVTGIVGIGRDITELKQLIFDLEAFSQTVAHDLKAPLSTCLGYINLVNNEYNNISDEDKQDYLQTAEETLHKMFSIIDELLGLAKIRSSEDINLAPIDMDAVVAAARERLTYVIEEAGAQIHVPSDWPPVRSYAPWIEEIWANYISNALKYGGDPPLIELGATKQPDNTICFWVRDNGRGIPEDKQSQLFTPFTQLNQNNMQGHGLGLSIVKRIVEKLGGQAGVENEAGKGSTFYFTLPSTL